MFIKKLLKCVLLLFTAALPTQAFWWAPPSATTTTESPLTLKQIPLTYFRTYTYQPIPGNPFAAFPFYHHTASALPSPLLAGSTRFEHASYMPAGAYPMSMALHAQQQPPQLYQLPHLPMLHMKPLPSPITTTTSTTTTKKPPTTTSTTTTTTTTTPPPPTTTTTVTTASSSTRATTSAPVSPLTSDVHNLPAYGSAAAQPYPYPYPTYNRRAYAGYNPHYYRGAYPYPDYTVTRFNSQGGPIKFVPCMCPVSVGSSGSGGESNAALLVQGRTADGEDGAVTVLERTADMNASDDHKKVVKKEGESPRVEPAVEFQVDGQVAAENDLKQKLAQNTVATGVDQLSTNKIEEEGVRATRETERRERNKQVIVT